MSAHVTFADKTLTLIWTFYLYFILLSTITLKFNRASPIIPASGDWTCNAGHALLNRTLRAGIHAGEFKEVGPTKDLPHCIKLCCEQKRCDVALRVTGICFLVNCHNNYLCQPVPSQNALLLPEISYVVHNIRPSAHVEQADQSRDLNTLAGFLKLQQDTIVDTSRRSTDIEKKHQLVTLATKNKQHGSRVIKNTSRIVTNKKSVRQFHLGSSTKDQKGRKRVEISSSIITKTPLSRNYNDKHKHESMIHKSTVTSKSGACYPTTIHESVSLKYGPDSGDFYDYGNIGVMEKCVDLCCQDKDCDVAFMIGRTCYTTSCYTIEKCRMIPASKTAQLRSQLAYVIKRNDLKQTSKLAQSKKNEVLLREEQRKQFLGLSGKHSEIGEMSSNVPNSLLTSCRHGDILLDHRLVGGTKAGVYKYRGRTPGFPECFALCCSDTFCDVAFLLDKKCYSVQCYKNTNCESRRIKARSLHSTMAYVSRGNEDDMNKKRADIPGVSPTDQQFTVTLNVTNQEYQDAMSDNESFEFLNFAEVFQKMIGDLYGDVQGFKFIDVMSIKQGVLLTEFTLVAEESVNGKVLLQRMVDVMRKGGLKNRDEPATPMYTVDVRGFNFKNSKGQSLVCHPEHNFNVDWPLAVYKTTVNIPCPRKANGLTSRYCHQPEDKEASWIRPNFSQCVSQKYEDLYKQTQQLNNGDSEITSASIIDKLSQYTTEDTYGDDPPKEFMGINGLGGKAEEEAKHHPSKPLDEVPFAAAGHNGGLPEAQLRKYLDKMSMSGLLGKTGFPDMMTLYKQLSKNGIGENIGKLSDSAEWNFPVNDHHEIKKLEAHKQPVRPISFQYDHVTEETSNRDWSNANNKEPIKSEQSFWSPQKPINPIDTHNAKPASSLHFDKNKPSLTPHKHYQKPIQIKHLEYVANQKLNKRNKNNNNLRWQMYYQQMQKPTTNDNFRRNSFPQYPSGYGYLGDSQQNYIDYSQIFPNSLKRKRRNSETFEDSNIALNKLKKSTKQYSQSSRKRRSTSSDEVFLPSLKRKRGIDSLDDDDDYINLIGTAELQEMTKSTDDGSDRRVINVKAKPQELRSKTFNYKFLDDDGHEFKTSKRDKYPTFRLALVKNSTSNSFQFVGVKYANDSTNLEQLPKKAKADAKSSVNLSRDPSLKAHSKVEAEVTVQKCEKKGLKTVCKTVNLPDDNPDVLHSKQDSQVVTEHENPGPTLPESTSPGSVSSSIATNDIEPTHAPDNLVTRPLPPPPDSELPDENEGDIEPENARTTLKPPEQAKSHHTASQENQHQTEIHSIQNILVKETSPQHSDDKNKGHSTEIKTQAKVEMTKGHGHDKQHTVQSETHHKGESHEIHSQASIETDKTQNQGKSDPNKSNQEKTGNNIKIHNEVNIKTSKPRPLISITVLNKTIVSHITHPAEIEKVEVEQTPTPPPTTALPSTTSTTLPSTTPTAITTTPPPKQHGLFILDRKIPDNEQATMFGGDIMLAVDITEEIVTHAQKRSEPAQIQEVEEFLQASSSVLDDRNIHEWKNAVKHFNHLRNEEENGDDLSENESTDRTDWKILHRQKSLEKEDLLLGYVSTISTYGITVSKKLSQYDAKYKKAIITKNIMMHLQILSVDGLEYKKKVEFPQYKEDVRLSSWNCAVEKVAFTTENFKDKLDPSETVHMTFFRFKTIGEIQRSCAEKEDCDEEEPENIIDENPIKVDSQLLTVHVEPEFSKPIKTPVIFTFANDDMTRANLPHDCAHWNATENEWKDDGCRIVSRNASVTTCQCEHLSIVSVLVNTAGVPMSPPKTGAPPQIDYDKNDGEPNIHAGGASVNVEEPKGGEPSTTISTTDSVATTVGTTLAVMETTLPPTTTTTTTTASDPSAGKSHQSETKTTRKKEDSLPWWWWLVLLLLLLLLLLLCCCLICCCYCRKKKKDDDTQSEEATEPISTATGADSHNLVDKSKPDTNDIPHHGLVTPGTTSLSTSPEPSDAPGWRKLRSHAHHPRELLMKEKALLFKDYIQPYNFTSSNARPPDTSRESIFGSTIVPSTVNPESQNIATPEKISPRLIQKRQYEPLSQQQQQNQIIPKNIPKTMSALPASLLTDDGSTDSSPETIHREPTKPLFHKPYNPDNIDRQVVPNNLTQASSMEWDPFIDNKNPQRRGNKGIPRRRKIVSPIDEGDEEEQKPAISMEVHAGSMQPESPDYSETSSYVDSAPSSYKTRSSPTSTIRSGDEYSTTSDGTSSTGSTTSYTGSRTSTEPGGWTLRIQEDTDEDLTKRRGLRK